MMTLSNTKININIPCPQVHLCNGFRHLTDHPAPGDDKKPCRSKADGLLLGRYLENDHVRMATRVKSVVLRVGACHPALEAEAPGLKAEAFDVAGMGVI